ncbi:uncharacterized protein N7496_001949 [Penicillium cataractarum]|uniref:Uncharacterized protein n=1 Tax=Penicillium cataractarum TaxID=2100454 RepID=A0A9W9VWY1_9EURO|nr:uncharacterized protein N7496_001949 [Penicillium cataractarum]KAJ5390881.1 hypothetical protein N7496_001949 [Penicillium cataractarum]
MVIVWTPEWDNKLLVAIWETCGSKFDWETTAEIMGGTCTPEAIMQHLRTMTRKAAERRREQRQILLEAHATRAASVAKGKAKRKWGYNRSALKRIEGMGKGNDSDASAENKTKTSPKRRSKRSLSIESAPADDASATNETRRRKSHQQTPDKKKQKRSAGHRYNDNTGEKSTKDENRDKVRTRGNFWNNYDRDDKK